MKYKTCRWLSDLCLSNIIVDGNILTIQGSELNWVDEEAYREITFNDKGVTSSYKYIDGGLMGEFIPDYEILMLLGIVSICSLGLIYTIMKRKQIPAFYNIINLFSFFLVDDTSLLLRKYPARYYRINLE